MEKEKLNEVESWLIDNHDLWEGDKEKYEALKESRYRYISLLHPSDSYNSNDILP